MPNSLFDPNDRRQVVGRIQALTPDSQRQWGTMELPKALCHMADQLRLALGEIEIARKPSAMGWPVVRSLVVRYLPFPKGVKTAPELLRTDAESLEEARASLLAEIDRVVARGEAGSWAPHPLFGPLGGADWGILMDRHLDHHLRQFGV